MSKQNGQRLLVPLKQLHETVSVCKACPVGAMGTNEDSRPRPLKVILSSEQDLELLLSLKRKLASLRLTFFSGAEGRYSAQVQSGRGESCHPRRQDYITPHHTETTSMAGASKDIRLPKPVAYKKLLAIHTNACSLVPKLGEAK